MLAVACALTHSRLHSGQAERVFSHRWMQSCRVRGDKGRLMNNDVDGASLACGAGSLGTQLVQEMFRKAPPVAMHKHSKASRPKDCQAVPQRNCCQASAPPPPPAPASNQCSPGGTRGRRCPRRWTGLGGRHRLRRHEKAASIERVRLHSLLAVPPSSACSCSCASQPVPLPRCLIQGSPVGLA